MIYLKRSMFPRCAVDVTSTFAFVVAAVMIASLAPSSSALAQDIAANTAQGSITVNGKKTEFRYAYAMTRTSLSSKKPETVLIISDKPLAANAVGDDVERMQAQRRDDLKMIELKFDDRKTLVGTNFEVVPLVVSAFSTEFKITIESFTDEALTGRFNSLSDHKMRDHTYAFDVRFNAAMMVPPSALSGEDAWATAPGRALAEYLRAARAGDKAAMKRAVIPEVARIVDSPKSADIVAFLKSDAADPKTAEISSLTVDGNTAKAKVTKRSKDGSKTTGYSLQKIGNSWLVDP